MHKSLILLMLLTLAIAGCGRKRYDAYKRLDERAVNKLVESDIPGLFLTKLDMRESLDTSNVAYHCARACAEIKTYFQYVTYPYTICTPPDFVVNENMVAALRTNKQDSVIAMLGKERPYTHTVTGDPRFGVYNKLFCKTVGGPWGAFLEDRQFCGFCGDAPHQFTMNIPGLSDKLAWVWWGTFYDKPAGSPAFNINDQSLSSVVNQDCNPNDLTNCGVSNGGGGPIQ